MSTTVSLKDLLEAGCHFGHQSQRWNPKASSYIYTERDNIHIIDLAKTRDGITLAISYLTDLVLKGGKVLFVGTKRQAKDIVKKEAVRAGVFYITERWPGGLLTNFEVIKKNLQKMKDFRAKLASDEERALYTKKEVLDWEKELAKLEMVYGGIEDLDNIPEAMFVVDVKKEDGAIREAKKRGITIVGVVDTNSDPSKIDFPIPANDDAVGSISIITKYIADALEEAKKIREKSNVDQLKTPLQGKQNSKAVGKETTVEVKVKDGEKKEVKELKTEVEEKNKKKKVVKKAVSKNK